MTTEDEYRNLENLRYALQDATWVHAPSAYPDAHAYSREISGLYQKISDKISSYEGVDLTTCKCGSDIAFMRRTLSGGWYWICPTCKRYVTGKTHDEAALKALDYYNGDGPASVLTKDPFTEPGGD